MKTGNTQHTPERLRLAQNLAADLGHLNTGISSISLYATAPELLERFKRCANAFHVAVMFSLSAEGHNDDFGRCKQATCENSRALIAKAEGRGEK